MVKSVYCAEWTDSLYTTEKMLCFVRISEKKTDFPLYCIKWLVFINVVESVYWRNGLIPYIQWIKFSVFMDIRTGSEFCFILH
jgi:hypothetical protein